MQDFNIAGVQFHPEYGMKQENLRKIGILSEKAKDMGADLVFFPELSITGFIINDQISQIAEKIPGPTTVQLEAIAKKLHVFLCAGSIEIHNGLHHNATIIVGPEGFIGAYRKVHLPTVEYPWYSSGGTFPIFNVRGWKVGISTCCDNLFSEQARILAINGAEIMLSPFCWLYENDDSSPVSSDSEPNPEVVKKWIKGHWKKLLPARAYENGLYILAANQYGQIGKSEYFATGGVLLIGPDGETINEDVSKRYEDEIVVGKIDKEKLTAWRMRGNYPLKLRRPEIYEDLIKRK
jgi:predicted amidohydrolase